MFLLYKNRALQVWRYMQIPSSRTWCHRNIKHLPNSAAINCFCSSIPTFCQFANGEASFCDRIILTRLIFANDAPICSYAHAGMEPLYCKFMLLVIFLLYTKATSVYALGIESISNMAINKFIATLWYSCSKIFCLHNKMMPFDLEIKTSEDPNSWI
jgi:hypothetical protein